MIDRISGERVVVLISEEYGPYFRISGQSEPEWLKAILEGKYYLPYWVSKVPSLDGEGMLEYFFGCAADQQKLQAIVDKINFEG
ncbi:hypothetical protein JFU04_20385 [Pseudomonas sp. TH21]|uniref:hypothetical protein n=1 Tax=Pseudomonas sp. TH21 TaxID=2796387 RepID=UPI0019122B8F|nr:hypothetical protein [Pseudomonas sp. TH21]MBK5478435.1 hypothetical protein [Pseudomonas sp. TH21]